MPKPVITKLEVFEDRKGVCKDICITGRLLGIIKEKNIFALLNNKEFQRKTFSKRTVSVHEVNEYINISCGRGEEEQSENIRLVLVAKTLDNCEVTAKSLFISDKLDFVAQVINNNEITVNSKKDTCIFIEEITEN